MKLVSFLGLFCGLALLPALSQPSNTAGAQMPGLSAPRSGLVVVNYVSYWWLDPTGYHPAILLKVENQTGQDLTGERIRFQARFVNTQTGQVTVGREELRKPFAPRQRILTTVRAPQSFELPISTSEWPPLECKVMARIGDVSDEGTQTLVVATVDKVAMEDEEAFRNLEKLREYTQTPVALRRSCPEDIKGKAPGGAKAKPGSRKPATKQTGHSVPGGM